MAHPDLILEPGRYEGVPAYQLLESAGHGYIPVDQRLLHAILDFPENSLPDIVRFAAQNHEDDLMDLDPLLIDLLRSLRNHLRQREGAFTGSRRASSLTYDRSIQPMRER